MKIEVVCNDYVVTAYEASAPPRRGDRISFRARLDDTPSRNYVVDDVVHVVHNRQRGSRDIAVSELTGVVVYVEEKP